MEELKKYMASLGFEANVECSGTVERFPRRGKDNVAWVIAKKIAAANREIIVAHFGDWSTGESHKFETAHSDADPIENAEILKEIKAQEESSRQLKKESQEAAKKKAEYIYSASRAPDTIHPYLETKKLEPIHLTKVASTGDLVCPVFDILTDELTSLQFIKPDGTKTFLPGGRLKGAGFLWQPVRRPERILVAEGIATAASIHEASPNDLVVAAFYASNLFSVCDALRKKHKDVTIYVCADNDAHKEKNTGLDAARAVAQRVSNCHVLYPSFTGGLYEIQQPKDWNDYHAIHGLPKLKEELMRQIAAVSAPVQIDNNLKSLIYKNAQNKMTLPSQEMVAQALVNFFGDDIIRQENDIFIWRGTHWENQSPINFRHRLRRMAQVCFGGMGKTTDLDSAYSMFMSMVDVVPEGKNLFAPNRFGASYLDGTVWTDPQTYKITFEEHRRGDYLNNCTPVNWNGPDEDNDLLLDYLDRAFRNDPDKAGKIRALQQMAGSCLLPAFPHIFFCQGKPGTGKSTIAKLCGLMLTDKVRARVQPQDMLGFMAESLINKLVNIHTDISKAAIPDNILKLIEDGDPVHLNRKNRLAVDAYIPNLHIWCCNTLPKSTDGDTGAYGRRVTIIKFEHNFIEDGQKWTKFYENVIWKHNPQGVVSWAKRGLIDLMQNEGKFFNPESGLSKLKEWNAESDIFAQFIEAINAGEVGFEGAKISCNAGRIKGTSLWVAFTQWATLNGFKIHECNIQKMFAALRNKNFDVCVVRGSRHIRGFSVQGDDLGGEEVVQGDAGVAF